MENSEKTELVWMKARDVGIVGHSEGLYRAVSSALNAAPTEVSVLILGANGTGKEQLARLIHEYSRASGRQFLTINCASIAPNLFESEMFGHEKGAFTGANTLKKGAFELAHGGTLFLDELGEMPVDQQAKLLRVMQTGRCRRVGSNSQEDNIEARPRIVAATNVDPTEALENGKLREDLFYRLTRQVHLPPLAQRREDIPLLAMAFLAHFNENYASRKGPLATSFSPCALRRLENHTWPGNIRELRNVIENAFIDACGPVITEAELSITPRRAPGDHGAVPTPSEGFDSKAYLDSVRDRLYQKALEMTGGKLSQASRLLGITKQTLQQWNDKQA